MTAFQAELRPDPDDRDVLAVEGDIDLANAQKLVAAAAPLLAADDRSPVLLDLAGVTFLDSTGIGALLEVRNQALVAERHTEIVAMSGAVERVLELAGLSHLFGANGKAHDDHVNT